MKLEMYIDDEMLMNEEQNGTMIPMIFPEDEDFDYDQGLDSVPAVLPVMTLRNLILFPAVTIPIMVGREKTKRLLDYLETAPNKHLLLVAQKEEGIEDPKKEDLLPMGVIGEVIRVMQVQDDFLTVIVQGKRKIRIDEVMQDEPFMLASYSFVPEVKPQDNDVEYSALISSIKETVIKILLNKGEVPKPIATSISGIKNPESILNFACVHLTADLKEKLSLLMINDLKSRAYKVLTGLNTLLQLLEMKNMIQRRTRSDIDKQQKDYFLQQQMKVIREELQEDDEDDTSELLAKGLKKKWSKEVHAVFQKEVRKLQRMNPQSPDYSVQIQYLQTMLDLPWNKVSKDKFDIKSASKVLDKDHFGLENVKERILEHLAVLKLKGDLRAPILCLYGPPGVGKTSLGQSIAKALGRSYVRISLGGLHDEAEIRGHRRTYIGAMPGRIIKGFIRAGQSNPVFVLDEIDKLAQDYKGDPSSALLEVLDPEQNSTFHDNYLDIDYDLSKVLFIATANDIAHIPGPLRDRMEMIEVSGYIIDEKIEIAQKHLLPKALERHGLTKKQVKISKATIAAIIENYTKESGVRALEKQLSRLMRRIAKNVAGLDTVEQREFSFTIKPDDLYEYLGAPKFSADQYEGNDYAGVVTGLAWTSVGGEILMVESAVSPSRAGKMSITGNLGEVMKESAILALEYIKSHSSLYNIPADIFDYWNVHIHVPEGAIPKDGPSAGITLTTSLISTFTQRKVKPSIAMTGEITLRGKVLPVGGIKEKILAAKRSGIKTIILCKENEKNIKEINEVYLKGLEFIYVSDIREVIDSALSSEQVKQPIDLMAHVEEMRRKQHSEQSKSVAQ